MRIPVYPNRSENISLPAFDGKNGINENVEQLKTNTHKTTNIHRPKSTIPEINFKNFLQQEATDFFSYD